MNPKILLVEDSVDIGLLVTNGLNAITLCQAYSIAEAEIALRQDRYNLLLIDVALPDGNGFDLCLRLSQDPQYRNIPKILLTAMDKASDKVYGFNCGADDYLTKPFHPMELRARVERYLRKAGLEKEVLADLHGFSFNLEFQKCSVIDGATKTDLGLTPTEFRLFLTLAKSEGRVLSRRVLEQATWEAHGATIQTRGIDTHIAHLRKKLGPLKNAIVSVYGQGYSFNGEFRKPEAA